MNSSDLLQGTLPAVLGTMTFGDSADEGEVKEIVSLALDRGIVDIDTANVYAGGRTEEILGRVLPKEGVTIATKVGAATPDAGGNAPLSAKGIELSFAECLRRLRRDRVDLLYLHMPDRSTPLEETVGALASLAATGSIGAIGVSNYAAWQVEKIRQLLKDAGLELAITQQVYNPIARRLEAEYVEYAVTSGLPTVIYNPLAGGLLTGRYRTDAAPDSGRFGPSSTMGEMYRGRYWTRPVLDAVDALGAIADKAGISLIELSIRWLLAQDVTTALLLGASKRSQLEGTIDAVAAGPLGGDLVAEVAAATDPLLGSMPAYNR